MADLVSHPDEVKVVSRRFGLGATDIDRYLELDGYKAVQKALGMEPAAIIDEVRGNKFRFRVRLRTRCAGSQPGVAEVVADAPVLSPAEWIERNPDIDLGVAIEAGQRQIETGGHDSSDGVDASAQSDGLAHRQGSDGIAPKLSRR